MNNEIDWSVRYPPNWKDLVIAAHRATKGICCCCRKNRSEEVHHSRYRGKKDKPGTNLFPVCFSCHDLCHSPNNWIKHKANPVWKNKNTSNWEKRLKIGFKILKAMGGRE